ncbi:uncharacterized protein si:ch211-180a12.2 isoform X2 [Clupea harengus]|uniref:Uncharacterized protein si:ch211-180a12.2 isoform X2 n=1 Tax=Clupea harengus TaxID=7950 RepID=A0A8M1KHM2_CLUHA|nr:uncharacterized protein si:ch211-180a12.2 isoform X2 [Clupea harengus]
MKFKVLSYYCLLGCIILVVSEEVLTGPSSSVDLPCSKTWPEGIESDLLKVTWLHNHSVVASNVGNHTEPGYSLNASLILNGSFPLTVRNASFGQQGVYECYVRYNDTQVHFSNVTLLIMVPPSLSVLSSVLVLGRESILQCEATGFNPPQISFLWTHRGQEVTSSTATTTVTPTPGGLYRAVSGLPVTLTPPVNPNVTFGCEVTHVALKRRLVREFKPRPVYLPEVSVSTVPTSKRASPLTLSCDITGFSPQNVSVLWIQNGSALPVPPPTQLNLDSTYRTRRFYTLTEEQRNQGGEVHCVVNQPHITEPVSGSVNLTAADPQVQEQILTKSAKASVAMMIISLTLVFLMCFGFSWRRRDEKVKSLNVSGIILPPRVVVGQKGRITVSIEGRRADRVQAAWFLNDLPIVDTTCTGPHHSGRASRVSVSSHPYSGRMSRISVTSMSEKGPLLPLTAPGYYKLHTQQPLHSSSADKQLLSSVTFIPNLTLHKGAVFKCQVSYKGKDKVVEEKVSDKFTVLATPEVSEIKLSDSSGDADTTMLTVQASRFHPDVITFRWFCEGGELSPVALAPALAAPRPDGEGFFSAMSQCRLPRAELERGGTKVWVTVHHIALKQPITRKTTGFIKKPSVSEITSASHNAALTFSCEVTGFYPPDVSVTWLQLRTVERRKDAERGSEEDEDDDDDDEERVEITEGTQLWGPLLTDPATFRATAVLEEPGSGVKGVEPAEGVMCRVDHCSLQAPVERVWRRAHIVPPSIPPSLSVRWTGDGVGVFSLLLRGGSADTTLLWAAGGATMSLLSSEESKATGAEGHREMTSTCAVLRLSGQPSQGSGTNVHSHTNGHTHKPKPAMLECEAEVAFIDEEEEDDGVRRTQRAPAEKRSDGQREKKEESTDEKSEQTETEMGLDPAYINRVRLGEGEGGGEREPLRVSVEITHPALSTPVYRIWTEAKTDARL